MKVHPHHPRRRAIGAMLAQAIPLLGEDKEARKERWMLRRVDIAEQVRQ